MSRKNLTHFECSAVKATEETSRQILWAARSTLDGAVTNFHLEVERERDRLRSLGFSSMVLEMFREDCSWETIAVENLTD